jgi:opacity protein-like surface antigen
LLLGGGVFLSTHQHSKADIPKIEPQQAKTEGSNGNSLHIVPPVEQDDDISHDQNNAPNSSLTKPSATDKTYTLRSVHSGDQASAPFPISSDHQKGARLPSVKDDDALATSVETKPTSSGDPLEYHTLNLSFPALRTALNQGQQPQLPFRTDMASTQKFCIPPCGIPGCPDFREYRNDWYLEAFGSVDMPFKSLQANDLKTDFLPHKDSTERMLVSYSAGLRVSKNLTNNLLLKTGFHYSQINERFDYKNESEKKIVTVITIRTVIRGPGDTLLVRDTSQVETVGVRIKRTYNKYRNIDIPLILSWELRKPDFTIGINGGLLFNIRSTFQGDMLDTSLVPMSQTAKAPSSQIRTNWGLGLYAGVSFIKPVSPVMDVFAEPWYRVYLKNAAADAAPFQQRMSAWGLQVGIRYKFNNSGQRY